MSGILYGVGVGPGDPELLTVKAARLLERVSVVAYPSLASGVSMARDIAAQYFVGEKVEIAIKLSMGDSARDGVLSAAYKAAAQDIAVHLDDGCDVAVLCEGDPMLFGSFIYLMERLGKIYLLEIVPGISSVMAGAAALRMPLAIREDRFLIVPATCAEDELENALRTCDRAVIMKVGRHLAKVRRVLRRLDMETCAYFIERASTAQQKIVSFVDLSDDSVPYFSLIVISKKG